MAEHERAPQGNPGARQSAGTVFDRDAIKAHFIAERGYWRPWTDALLRHNPAFLQRYATYAGHPARVGPLSARMVELIYVGLDASATHLFASGLKTHMARALEVGARPTEIFDVLHRVAAQGLDGVYRASAILAEEARLSGTASPAPAVPERAVRLLPMPAPWLAAVATLDPGYVDALLDFLEYGGPADGLTPAEGRLVDVALNACFTGLNPTTLRLRIRAALADGTSPAELLQAIQLGAHLAVHGTALGAGVFEELQGGRGG